MAATEGHDEVKMELELDPSLLDPPAFVDNNNAQQNKYRITEDINEYSDYNLLFNDNVSLLGNGFHSPTTTTNSRFDFHPRVMIYFIVMALSLTANFLYFAQISIAIINALIHIACLCYGIFITQRQTHINDTPTNYWQRSRKSTIGLGFAEEQIKQLDSLSPDQLQSPKHSQQFQHSYTNAMNWIFRVSNTYETVPKWLSWALPGIMLYCELMLVIVLAVWGSKTAPGQYCKSGYPEEFDPDFETGGCFLQKEIALFYGLCSLLGIIEALGSLYDISPQSMISIELAKKRIRKLFNRDVFEDDYFALIKSERRRLIKPFVDYKRQSFWVSMVIIVIWSLHVLYWESRLLFRVKENVTHVVGLYILNVIGFIFVSYCIVDSMFTIKNVYKDYWVIMQVLARPLRINTAEDIRPWLEIRKLYMNYQMVIYFGCANTIVLSYVVIAIICIFILIYWQFFAGLHVFSVGTFAVAVGAVVFTSNLLHILALCADISGSNELHVNMLQQERHIVSWKIRNNKVKDETDDNTLQAIDDICQHITKYDKSPKILAVPMTWALYNVMLAYAVSGCISVLGAIVLG